jgi:hypothetical protein
MGVCRSAARAAPKKGSPLSEAYVGSTVRLRINYCWDIIIKNSRVLPKAIIIIHYYCYFVPFSSTVVYVLVGRYYILEYNVQSGTGI